MLNWKMRVTTEKVRIDVQLNFDPVSGLSCAMLISLLKISGFEWTALDESLDREVLLLLQGPEQVGEKFKATIRKLVRQCLVLVNGIMGELGILTEFDLEVCASLNPSEKHGTLWDSSSSVCVSLGIFIKRES